MHRTGVLLGAIAAALVGCHDDASPVRTSATSVGRRAPADVSLHADALVESLAEKKGDLAAALGAIGALCGRDDGGIIVDVDLNLINGPITAAGLTRLAELGSLRRLTLEGQVDDEALHGLPRFVHLQELSLRYCPRVTSRGLAVIAEYPELRVLVLDGTGVGDEGLAHVQGLSNLRELNLYRTKVTDAGMMHLARMSKLETLVLGNCRAVGDIGARHLAVLVTLKELNLSHTQLTDVGLEYLRPLVGLETLTLVDTKITDAGLKHLAAFADLRFLNLGENAISDAGLAKLKALPKLEGLHVTGELITDAGMAPLRSLVHLRRLSLLGTRVTQEGEDLLVGAVPNLEINRRAFDGLPHNRPKPRQATPSSMPL